VASNGPQGLEKRILEDIEVQGARSEDASIVSLLLLCHSKSNCVRPMFQPQCQPLGASPLEVGAGPFRDKDWGLGIEE
jgi:hypothetical protein